MHDDDIPTAEAAEFARAFDLYVKLDEVKATAERLRAAADRTTGLEFEANIRQAKEAEVEVARVEAALRGEELTEAIPSAAGLPGGLREGDVAREQPIPESQTDEGHRKRRIELIEEGERARLRVRDEWQRERQGTVGEADQDSRPELTPMKRKAIIERLGRRYPALASAVDRPEEWAKACRVPKEASPDGKQGWYYLERIEAECRTRYGGAAPTPAADLSLAGQLHDINR